jgi:hypothetical protein
MKKGILVLTAIFAVQLAFCQQNDSTKISDNAAVVAPTPAEPVKPGKERRDTRPLNQRIAFGFGSSFWITPSQTYVELAPVLAYRFPKTLITGIGYRYIYRHQRVIGENLNAYGPNVFARINVIKRVYLWTEYEILTNEYETHAAGVEFAKDKTYTDSWFAGIGYIRRVGKKGRGGVSVQILYNILYNRDDNSPYYSPVTYRVGYYF